MVSTELWDTKSNQNVQKLNVGVIDLNMFVTLYPVEKTLFFKPNKTVALSVIGSI